MPCSTRPKCLQLRNLPKSPTSLRSVNFRHTTPGSGLVLLTKYKPQPTSDLFSPIYPGAHLPLDRRCSLAPCWISPRLTLYAFPKAFLSKPDAPYPKPYKPRPYPASTRRKQEQEQKRGADMSMQVVSFNARVVLRPAVRAKIKRRLKEAIRLIVTRGAAVEESHVRSKLVFRVEDVGADKWIAPDWTYMALPTTAMFRMPFVEQLGLIRNALELLRRRIPEVERILRQGENRNATSSVGSTVSLDPGKSSARTELRGRKLMGLRGTKWGP